MEFHHIGIATKDIAKSAHLYSLFGYKVGKQFFDPIQKVDLCFLEKVGFPVIELVSPVEETSPVNNILNKNGTIPYHTCYVVADLDAEIINLKKGKFLVVVSPVPAVAFDYRRVCFLYHKMSGLIELLEK